MSAKQTMCRCGCGDPAVAAGLSRNCYSRLHYAMKKGVRWAMDRADLYRKYQGTLSLVEPKVVSIRSRRRA